MFAAVVLALFAYNICKIEIQCSVIRQETFVEKAGDSSKLPKNLTLLKKIGNIVIQSKSTTPSRVGNRKLNISIGESESRVDLDARFMSKPPLVDEENQIRISNRKTLRSKDNAGLRQPKFFGSLAFLSGLGAASLANAATGNVNTIVKLLNSPAPVPIGAPGYFTGFYDSQHYLPFSYPFFYPLPRTADNYHNFFHGIPANPFFPPRQISNTTTEKSLDKTGTDISSDAEATEKPATNEKTQNNKEAAASQADLKRAAAPDPNEDKTESSDSKEEVELRQDAVAPGTTTTPQSVTMNATITPNITGSLPFYGYYYGGSPQEVGHIILTTEDPQQRYVKDYNQDSYSLPFERPAVFNRYHNDESYPSSFVNSFSPGEPFPEFLNTIESDRYVYDSENRGNFNGFRPILK